MELSEKLEVLYPSISDEIIEIVIEDIDNFILNYLNVDEVPAALAGTRLQMAKEDLNRIGAEGISSESAGGSTISYNGDYSDTVYKALNKHRRFTFM